MATIGSVNVTRLHTTLHGIMRHVDVTVTCTRKQASQSRRGRLHTGSSVLPICDRTMALLPTQKQGNGLASIWWWLTLHGMAGCRLVRIFSSEVKLQLWQSIGRNAPTVDYSGLISSGMWLTTSPLDLRLLVAWVPQHWLFLTISSLLLRQPRPTSSLPLSGRGRLKVSRVIG